MVNTSKQGHISAKRHPDDGRKGFMGQLRHRKARVEARRQIVHYLRRGLR